MGIVHDAFLWHLQTEQEDNDRAWQEAHSHHLAVSDLGHCVRKAYLRLRKSQETHPHDDYVLSLMRDGNVYQDDTARALAAWYGSQVHWDKDDPALCVGDDKWLGHLDFLVCTSTGDVIVEHKATNPDNFCKRNRLPYPFHCYQLAGYGILRQKMGHPPARLLLYYRSWGHWAEVELFSNEFGISWEGEFDGDYRGGMIDLVSLVGLKCTRSDHPKCAGCFHPNCTGSVHPKCASLVHPKCTSDVRPACTIPEASCGVA